jgi:3-oxoacyl-[acyl-carrier-protein] synthase II
MSRRVAITGLGVLSPIGSTRKVFWERLCAGTVGTAPIESFDTSIFDQHRGGEVRDVDPTTYFRRLDARTLGRTTQLGVAAARMALEDGKCDLSRYAAERIGVCMGTTMGNQSIVEAEINLRKESGSHLPAEVMSRYASIWISAAIGQEVGAQGPCLTLPTACAAGNYAIGHAACLLRDGVLDAALAGGSDGISRVCFSLFHRLGSIAPDRCQPFDARRGGMMVSEGAAVLLLEEMEGARARGATIYGELLSDGLACDAHHPTAPHPDGLGAALAMRRALVGSGLRELDVSYISAHGTGTRANDSTESRAVYSVFGAEADQIPVSSIKSMLGHTMGAASAIEAVACALAVYHGVLPPTVHYTEPDPDCLKNVVPNRAQVAPVRVAMSNSFGFGGNISTILIKREARYVE